MNGFTKTDADDINNVGAPVSEDKVKRPQSQGASALEELDPSETDQQKQARETEKALDRALTRLPPG